jgi:hypothetical protein
LENWTITLGEYTIKLTLLIEDYSCLFDCGL